MELKFVFMDMYNMESGMNRIMRFAVVAAGCAWLAGSAAAVPMAITYQGQLNEVNNGTVMPLGGTSAMLQVRLWNQAEGGTAVWGREIPVTLDNGAFNTVISDEVGSPLVTSSLASVIQNATDTLYIGLTVQGGEEISPRQRMLSAAYAVAAGSAEKSFGAFQVSDRLTVSNGVTVTGATALNGATTVGSMLTVSGKTDLNGDTETEKLTVNGVTTLKGGVTANSTVTVSGAATLNGGVTASAVTVSGTSTLNGAVAANSTLTVAGATALNGSTTAKAMTVNGALTATNTVTLKKGATLGDAGKGTVAFETASVNVNRGAMTLAPPTTLDVQGTFLRWYPLSTQSDSWAGWNEIPFNTEKTPMQDIILTVIGYCHDNGTQNDLLKVYFKVGAGFFEVASAHVRGWATATITVPIPKGQVFKIGKEGYVRAINASIFTYRTVNTNDWSTILN